MVARKNIENQRQMESLDSDSKTKCWLKSDLGGQIYKPDTDSFEEGIWLYIDMSHILVKRKGI